MSLLNIRYALSPAVNSLSILLFTNLITMVNVFKKPLSFKRINRLQVKHFYVHYVLISLLTIIFALVLEIIPKIKATEILLGLWGILLLVSFIYNFRSILLLIEMVFGSENMPKDEERI